MHPAAVSCREVIVKQDTRFYVHLPTDRMQIVHPMIRLAADSFELCFCNLRVFFAGFLWSMFCGHIVGMYWSPG